MAKRRNEDSQMSREQWEEREAAADGSGSPSSGGDADFQRASDADISGRRLREATSETPDATAAPTDASSTTASPLTLLELLQPAEVWIKSFFRLTNVREAADGVPGVATLETSSDMRHVAELLSVAVLLDATFLQEMVDASWIGNYSSSKPTTVGKLELELPVADASSMEQALTDMIVSGPSTTSDFPQCESIRTELLRRVAEAGKMEALLQLRVPVSCSISLTYKERKPRETPVPSVDHDDEFDFDSVIEVHRETDAEFYERVPSPDQVQTLFQRIAEIGQRVILSDRCAAAIPWTQFTFTKLQLNLYPCIPITPDVVRAARVLSQHSFVSVVDATVDPRMVHCSTNELSMYLRALSRRSPKFHLRTGYSPYMNQMTAIDADGEDKKELIVKMMTALASCTRLRSVDLGGCVSLLTQPRNRLHYWQALLEILLAPVPTVDGLTTSRGEFCLTLFEVLKQEDALLIQQVPGLTTRRRRRIDCVKLSSPLASEEASAVAVASLIRDMERLEMGNGLEIVPAAVVPAVLKVSPKLRSICLMKAEIPSLSVFSDPTLSASGKCLEEISLIWPLGMTQPSMNSFFKELLDPSTPLGTSLRALSIDDDHNRFSAFDSVNAELLERALCVNQRLQRIHIVTGPYSPYVSARALEVHNGDPVWSSSAPPEALIRQRCAFLSATALTQLDPMVVRGIFDFATPLLGKRSVSVYVRYLPPI